MSSAKKNINGFYVFVYVFCNRFEYLNEHKSDDKMIWCWCWFWLPLNWFQHVVFAIFVDVLLLQAVWSLFIWKKKSLFLLPAIELHENMRSIHIEVFILFKIRFVCWVLCRCECCRESCSAKYRRNTIVYVYFKGRAMNMVFVITSAYANTKYLQIMAQQNRFETRERGKKTCTYLVVFTICENSVASKMWHQRITHFQIQRKNTVCIRVYLCLHCISKSRRSTHDCTRAYALSRIHLYWCGSAMYALCNHNWDCLCLHQY